MTTEPTTSTAARHGPIARRWPIAAGCVAAALLVFLYYAWAWGSLRGFVAALDHGEMLFSDFQTVYYPAAQAALGRYAVPEAYFYPVFFALLLAPLGLLAPGPACWVWGAGQVLALGLLFALPLRRLLKVSAPALAAWLVLVLTSVPVLHNFKWGQVSVALTVLIMAGFHAHARGRTAAAGALLGLAAALKVYPALFMIYFVLRRQWRACAAFAVTFVLCYAVLPMTVLGPSLWTYHHDNIAQKMLASPWLTRDYNSQYFAYALARLIYYVSSQTAVPAPHPAAMALGWALAGVNFVMLLFLNRRHRPDDPALSAVFIFLSLPLLLKTSWPHYFVYLPFCQALLFARLAPRARARTGFAAGLVPVLLSCALSSVFALNLLRDWPVYSSLGTLLIANILLLPPAWALARAAGSDEAKSLV